MDFRALFFMTAAAVCGALAPATVEKFRWLPITLAIIYLLLSLASFLDHRSRRATSSDRDERVGDQPNRPVM